MLGKPKSERARMGCEAPGGRPGRVQGEKRGVHAAQPRPSSSVTTRTKQVHIVAYLRFISTSRLNIGILIAATAATAL